MRDVLEVIKSRRSVRNFKPDQIDQETLDKIIEAGIYAPSACNDQSWHFTVIQNPELLEHINNIVGQDMLKSNDEWIRKMASNPNFRVTYNAPTLIIVSNKKDGIGWQANCSAAIQNMLLAAESLEVGSVWLGLVRFLFARPEEVEKLGIPEGYEPYYGISFGYKSNNKHIPAPRRKANVVKYIK